MLTTVLIYSKQLNTYKSLIPKNLVTNERQYQHQCLSQVSRSSFGCLLSGSHRTHNWSLWWNYWPFLFPAELSLWRETARWPPTNEAEGQEGGGPPQFAARRTIWHPAHVRCPAEPWSSALRRSSYNSVLGWSHDAIPLLGLERQPQKSVWKHTTLRPELARQCTDGSSGAHCKCFTFSSRLADPLLNPN